MAALLNKEGTHISLKLVDAGDDVDQFIPTIQESTAYKPAYTIRYRTHKYNGEGSGASPPDLNTNDQKVVGSWKMKEFSSDKLKFKFPWLEWDFKPDNQTWTSDVGLLGGKDEMEWVLSNEGGGGSGYDGVNFTLRCVDTSDPERRVVSMVKVKNYLSATIEIPFKIIAKKEQLGELIVVSLAVMDQQRDGMMAT